MAPLVPPSFPCISFPGQHAATTITISSDSVVVVLSSDDDEATSRPRSAPRRRRPPSPPAASVRSPAVSTGGETPKRQRRAAVQRPRRASSPPASTTQQKPKRKYTKWSLEDDHELLAVMAELRKKNHGVEAPMSEVRIKLKARPSFSRPGVSVKELSDKRKRLKRQLKAVHGAGGIYHPRFKYNFNGEHHRIAKNNWPKLFV